MSPPRACPECLRRSWLLNDLAPYIERVATRAPGSRSPELLRLPSDELAEAVAPGAAGEILRASAALRETTMREEIEAAGCWALCRHGDLYPQPLHDAADAPWALIGRGDFGLLEGIDLDAAVTVVGARRATSYGREVARELGRDLAAGGLAVVSGMAFGIDTAAHRGALDAGVTFAVLGCGPDVSYPASGAALHRRIVERGLVLSEMPPGATPWKWSFPARNRVMAALAGMTVVVEAAERSGSLITAELATDLGRDVGAVPGPVGTRASAGPNELLAGGACLVRDAQDVLDAMLGPGAQRLEAFGPTLDQGLASVLDAVEGGARSCEDVAATLDLLAGEAAARLARLEALGYLSCSLLGAYTRTGLRAPE
jgi:DNA processing protein